MLERGEELSLFMNGGLRGHKIFDGLNGNDMQLSSAIWWVEGQPDILVYGSSKHSKDIFFLLQHFFVYFQIKHLP